jgi:hypothetical protein
VNWLGLSGRSLLGILLGVAVAAVLFVYVYPSVLVVGACTGAGCALLSEDRSGLRGVSVMTVATWAAAFLDAPRFGVSTLEISKTLTLTRWLAYIGCMASAFVMGSMALRRGAAIRTAGT